jgi:hypothetical protein
MVPTNVAFASLSAGPLTSSNRQLANRSAAAGELHIMSDAIANAATGLKFGLSLMIISFW